MTIIHDKWGEVEGVEVIFQRSYTTWGKTGAEYLETQGWREKVGERWEEDSGYLKEAEARGCLSFLTTQRLPADKRWTLVERYDLPANWRHRSINEGAENLTNWVEQFKRPCLIIERKVEE